MCAFYIVLFFIFWYNYYGGSSVKQYRYIMEYFGFRNQMKKLNEECYELIEAIDNYEDLIAMKPWVGDAEKKIFRDHIVEEMSDLLLLCTQFIDKYDITKDEIDAWTDFKLDRTQQNILNGHYDKKK